MFRPRKMLRVDVLLLQRDLDAFLRALARAGIFHLKPLAQVPGVRKEEEGPDRERLVRLRELERSLERLADDLGLPPAGGDAIEPADLDDLEDWTKDLAGRVAGIDRRRRELTRLDERLADLETLGRSLTRTPGSLADLREMHFGYFQAGLTTARSLENLAEPPPATILRVVGRRGDEVFLWVAGLSREREAIEAWLKELRWRPLVLPASSRKAIGDLPVRLRKVRKKVAQRIAGLDRKRERIRERFEVRLMGALRAVQLARSLFELRSGFEFTERVVVIGGWIPETSLKVLRKVLRDACGDRAVLRHSKAGGAETPVLLGNPRLLRPFERLLAFYGTPSYGELEPTPFLALGFLVLFGMMFGDLGHGLVFLVAGMGMRRWTRHREEGLIIAEMGIFAGFFGLLFGSFFGHEDLMEPLWFSPMHDIQAFMGAALALGAGLILTGLALRVWNGLGRGDLSVLADRYGLAGLVFYGGSLATALLVYQGRLPAASLLWLVLPLVVIWAHPWVEAKVSGQPSSSPGLLLAEGGVEVLETVLGFLANTFSFLRVAAFGLAHVGLFMAVFAVAEVVRGLPAGWFWVLVVHLLGNLVILLLEGLVVSVQTVRLEFYEIFSKFFQGGGIAYHPLELDRLSERRP